MKSSDIRKAYLDFFADKKHKIIPSSSLIPHGDPTLLLTTAGMVQIKPYFLGVEVPPNPRLASCQKCFRTTDIESVGDNRHLTFFEMLGNFSVGDYFKKEAIKWAWEFVTEKLLLDQEKLWVTIFLDDDEALKMWTDIGFPEERIVRLGEKDNFWGPAGDSGPCGPCSEIHFDFGKEYGCGNKDCDPSCSCGRFSEIWNLVFTEYNQDISGKRTRLPKPNIDTGMGLERVTAVCQGVKTVYETDLFVPVIEKISSIAEKARGSDSDTDRYFRIIAEHSRGITFLIADGVLPSNDGRGYVLRRILRRACFIGRKLGIEKPFMGDMAEVVINYMHKTYPELKANHKLIMDIIKNEEEKFYSTLDAGINLCEKAISEAKNENRNCLKSDEVFKFWDTYGFPLELSLEIAEEHGLTVDRDAFELQMEKQRERARLSHKFSSSSGLSPKFDFENKKASKFVGYTELYSKTKITNLLDATSYKSIDKADTGQEIFITLENNPFYGEMGGQVGDTGQLISQSVEIEITNSISQGANGILLFGIVKSGSVSNGDEVEAAIDTERRLDIARNHTATHLVQSVLKEVLGAHVSQRGSLVTPDKLRFDFTHLATISKDELNQIQMRVNDLVRKNLNVSINICAYNDAIKQGATAIFEEKYGDTVRVINIGEPKISAELCGGTHVSCTGEIGSFIILSEVSIGTGLRRIEAVTGRGAECHISEIKSILNDIAKELKSSFVEVPEKINSLQHNLVSIQKSNLVLQKQLLKYEVEKIIDDHLSSLDGINIVCAKVSPMPVQSLMQMGDLVKEKIDSVIAVFATVFEDKPYFVVTMTPDLIKKGLHSGKLIKSIVAIAGGSGGGKPEMAQAGAKEKEKIGEALEAVISLVSEQSKGKNA